MHGSFLQRLIAAVVVLGGALFVGLQFVRPALPHPPVTAEIDAPAPVKAVLRRSCYDCHSNETKLRWFDQIVPAYWLVAHDVKTARSRLNFSEIGARPAAQQKAELYEATTRIMLGWMPPPDYRLLHPDAVVTPEQLAVLKDYLRPARTSTPPTPLPPAPTEVRPAPNGMTFQPDYKNWRVLSTTDRFDNNTLRVITGNAIAMQAIADGNVRPWPDGSAFAKIAFAPAADGRAATFKQVEFMVKDAKQYAATEGWGWGRWVGGDLAPYGKDRDFAVECTHCHAPLRKNDFVFTLPLKAPPADAKRFNTEAALPVGLGLPADLLSWQATSSGIDAAAGTMMTLYANGSALAAVRAGEPYPAGAVLARVTWAERDDPHWFGARIPGKVQAVEMLTVSTGADGKPAYAYDRYSGSPLAKEASDPATLPARIDALLTEKASPMP